MEDERPVDGHPQEHDADEAEVVDGVIVLAGVRAIEPARRPQPPLRQVAAVAATGFVAGAATAAVVGRRLAARRNARAVAAADPVPALRGPTTTGVIVARSQVVEIRTFTRW